MKVSREQVALNRERIVETAARLFRQNGYDGIGVADLMKGAGLTHGGFYGHFASKEELLAEATAHGFKGAVARWRQAASAVPDKPASALATIVNNYVSTRHRDQPEAGCSVTALGPDIARRSPAVRQALTEGVQDQVGVLEALIGGSGSDGRGDAAEQRQRALATYAAMVGAVVLARAVGDPALSDDILAAVRATLAPPDA